MDKRIDGIFYPSHNGNEKNERVKNLTGWIIDDNVDLCEVIKDDIGDSAGLNLIFFHRSEGRQLF